MWAGNVQGQQHWIPAKETGKDHQLNCDSQPGVRTSENNCGIQHETVRGLKTGCWKQLNVTI